MLYLIIFYLEIKEEIVPATIKNTDMTIMLDNKSLRAPMGVVEDATVTIGNENFPIDFVVVDMSADTLFPIIFGRNFLGDIGAYVNFKKEIASLKLGGTENKFHFSKFKTGLQKYKKRGNKKACQKSWDI